MSKAKKRKERNMELAQWGDALTPYLYDYGLMESRLTCSIAAIEQMVAKLPNGSVYRDPKNKGEDNPYLFIDNHSDILAVAHLDATGKVPHFGRVNIRGDEWVLSRWLDDRLGVFLLLDVLPHFFTYDILLTTGEETGKSSARLFEPPEDADGPRQYKWMFEPDRMGSDVVHYQFYDRLMEAAVKAAGFTVYTHGAFSDIAELGHLGCCGINWGIGYEDNHSDWSRANLTTTLLQTARFCRLLDANREVVFPYVPKAVAAPAANAGNGYYNRGGLNPMMGGTAAGGLANGTRKIWFDPKFVVNQIVKNWSTKELLLVTTAGFWDAEKMRYTYWCMTRDPQNMTTSTHRSFNEVDLSGYLTPKDRPLAWKLYPKGGISDDLGSNRLVFAETPDTGLARPNENSAWTDTMKLNHAADGFAFDPDVLDARAQLEFKLYGGWLMQGSDEIPWTLPYDVLHINRVLLTYGTPVYTTGRNGRHKGVIDSQFPIMVRAEGGYWWVRFEKPDGMGLFVDLIHETQITIRETVVDPALPTTHRLD